MSKIIQERKMEGELAVAKPRSVCLISASLIKGQSSSFGPDVPNIREKPQLDSGSVKGARRKLQAELCRRSRGRNYRQDIVQNRVQNTQNVFSSLERRQPVSTELRETAKAQCPRRCA